MKTYEEFFAWCEVHALISDRQIAEAFARTPQTVRNWKKSRSRSSPPPLHLSLACEGFDARASNGGEKMPPITLAWFDLWRTNHALETLESTGDAFGLTRQAVHNWRKRGRLPRWLPLACLGYECRLATKVANKI